jgi:cell division ATPase FtsA
MSQGRLIVALDFGTTEFRSMVTEITADGNLELVGWSRQPRRRFRGRRFH